VTPKAPRSRKRSKAKTISKRKPKAAGKKKSAAKPPTQKKDSTRQAPVGQPAKRRASSKRGVGEAARKGRRKGAIAQRPQRVEKAFDEPFVVAAQDIANPTAAEFVQFMAHLLRAEVCAYGGGAQHILINFAPGRDAGQDARTNRSIASLGGGDTLIRSATQSGSSRLRPRSRPSRS
jgi:hypothetical protein